MELKNYSQYLQKAIRVFTTLLIVIFSGSVYAQNSVGIGTTTPNPNAILDLVTTDQGLLIPRLDTTTILSMPLTAADDGMLVYADEINAFVYWDGDSLQWYLLNENIMNNNGNDNDWYYNGDTLFNNSAHVVVGTSGGAPDAKMMVATAGEGIRSALRTYSTGDGILSIGIQGTATGSATSVGVSGYTQSIGGDTVAGVTGEAEAFNAAVAFGTFGKVSNGSNLGYAVFGEANGASGTGTMVGVFGKAVNGASNWAGYFDAGDVYVQNNIGLGTGTPANKLHVYGGSITIDDGVSPYTLPFSDGSSGQVLTTDGAGNINWSSAGASNNWGLTGNSGTTSGANFLGTTDAVDLQLKTNNTTALTIENVNQNVGIGTAPGTAKTSIYGNNTVTLDVNNINSGATSSYGIANTMSNSATGSKTGILNTIYVGTTTNNVKGVNNQMVAASSANIYATDNNIQGSGTGIQYGNYNFISNTGTGTRYGTYNYVNQPDATASNQLHGHYNYVRSVGAGTTYAARNTNYSTGTGVQYGSYNYLNNVGTGTRYGSYNYLYQSNNAATGGTMYGTRNYVNHLGSAATVYGIYNQLSGVNVTKYGVYNTGEDRNYFSGDVGIGTTIPSSPLDVIGNVEFSGDLRPNNLPGNSGEILTSQGSGLPPIWQSAAAASANIYNTNGTLTSARTVTQGTNSLTFTSSINNAFSVDGSTFSVDASSNRVGVGTTNPAATLNVVNNVVNSTPLLIQNETGGSTSVIGGSHAARFVLTSNGTEQKTALEVDVSGTGAAQQNAIFATADGASTSSFNRGIVASASNNTSSNYGGDFYATGNSGTNYGITSRVGGTQTNTKYAAYLTASGSGTKYGVYATGENYNYFSGSVGIANTAPSYPLDVTGNAHITANLGVGVAPSATYAVYAAGSSYGVRGDGTTMGGYFRDADGTASVYVGYSNYGIYQFGGTDNYFAGQVGIGTSAPTYSLDVVGATNLLKGGSGTALNVNGSEAIWYNGTYYSWGFGGTYNYFADMVKIGNTAHTQKLSVQVAATAEYVARVHNASNATNAHGLIVRAGSSTTSGATAVRFYNGGGSTMGSITQSGATSVAYNTTSDIRLKDLIGKSQYGLSDLMKINVYDYYYKADISKKMFTGFVAQELNDVYPQAVTVPLKGDVDDNGNETPWMVDYSSVTPLIIKATQDQQQQIETLKKENEDLRAELEAIKKHLGIND